MIAVFGLLGAIGFSVAGNAITNIAIPWLVLERTGSPGLAGLMAAASLGPMALSMLFGGALIDRWGRRRLSIVADILSALAVAALPILDSTVGLDIALIAVLVALGAVFDGPGMAAREALRPDVARHAGIPLERINAWGEALESLGNLVAPGIAAVFIATAGATNTLWVTAGMFVAAIVLTWCTVPRDARNESTPDHYLRSVMEGLKYVWQQRTLRHAGITTMLLVLFVSPITIVLTAQAQSVGDPGQLGVVLTAFAIGGIAGAIAYGAVAHKIRRQPILVGGLLITAVGIGLFAVFPSGFGMAVLAALVGVAASPITPITAVLIQERTPERLRGRVIGSVSSLALIAGPLGVSLAGALLEGASPVVAFVCIGVGALIATLYSAYSLRDVEALTGLPGSAPTDSSESRTTKTPLTSK